MSTPNSLLLLIPLLGACSAHFRKAGSAEPASRPVQVQSAAPDTVWFFLDGQEVRRADVAMIDPASIASVTHVVGPAVVAQYGPRARAVIEIISKRDSVATPVNPQLRSPVPLFLLDGRMVPPTLVRVLDRKRVRSIEVLKGPAALSYGGAPYGGVVLITSKADGG
jgi:hypothetical protein